MEKSFKELFPLLSEILKGEKICETVYEIWKNDRWFDFSRFSKTADYCAERLRKAGLEVEVLEVPADGRTKFGDWVMPEAWDVEDATLELIEPEEHRRILARYKEIPQSLIMHSAPTPKEGVEAEIVYVEDADKPESYEGLDLKGKVILTDKPAPSVEPYAIEHGAIGIASYKYGGHGVKAPSDSVAWENACFLPCNANKLFGFSLSPETGTWLKNLILELAAKDAKVKVKAIVKSKLYRGSFKVVSALIPGITEEEIWVIGHLYEPGANDNASGSSVMIEVAEGIKRLIEEGKLPKPKRGLRFIFTLECYGTMAYMLRHRGIESRVVAGINADMIGGNQEKCKSMLRICENPHVSLSFTDALAIGLARDILGEDVKWRISSYILDDNLIADPCFGIPTPSIIGIPDRFWHTSKDTPKILDRNLLFKTSCFIASYMLFIAYASLEDAIWLLEETYRLVESKVLKEASRIISAIHSLREEGRDDLRKSLIRMIMEFQSKLSCWREVGDNALKSVLRLASTEEEASLLREALDSVRERLDSRIRTEEEAVNGFIDRFVKIKGLGKIILESKLSGEEEIASGIVPERLIVGTLTFKDLPEDLRRECRWEPAYSSSLNIPLFWIDGRRSLLEIHRHVVNEVGKFDLKELIRYFRFLEKAGYVILKRKHN